MIVCHRRNVQHALVEGIELFREFGRPRASRNGPVSQIPVPVTTVYSRPMERVLFNPERDANPFFHFYESMWMLAGRDDVLPLTRFVKRMHDYSDDGKTFNAAYGARWSDQPMRIIETLKRNRDDRRCVLQIWRHEKDLQPYAGKDAACNIAATFQVNHEQELEMTVFCRSNDAIWGAWGANAVHFSMLQEFIARGAGIMVGKFYQISVNLHGYTKVIHPLLNSQLRIDDLYESGQVRPVPIMTMDPYTWRDDCRRYIRDDGKAPPRLTNFSDPFFYTVALPIVRAHDAYKDLEGPTKFSQAYEEIAKCQASDWRVACTEWIARRHAKWTAKR